MSNTVQEILREADPREDFPLTSFNALEDRLREFRIRAMRLAAQLAKHDATEDVYRVEIEHVLQALRELIANPDEMALILKLNDGE